MVPFESIYGFIFAFLSNYGFNHRGINKISGFNLHHFGDRPIGRKSLFHTPLHSTPPLRGPRGNIAVMFGMEKLEWWGYTMVKKKLRICLAVLTEYRRVADGHTVHLVTA